MEMWGESILKLSVVYKMFILGSSFFFCFEVQWNKIAACLQGRGMLMHKLRVQPHSNCGKELVYTVYNDSDETVRYDIRYLQVLQDGKNIVSNETETHHYQEILPKSGKQCSVKLSKELKIGAMFNCCIAEKTAGSEDLAVQLTMKEQIYTFHLSPCGKWFEGVGEV